LVAAVAKAAEGFLAAERLRADARLVRRYYDRYGTTSRRFTGVVAASGRVVQAEPSDWLGSRVDGIRSVGSWPQLDGTSIAAEPLGEGFVVWREGRAQPRAARVSVKVLGRDQATVVLPGGAQRELHLRHSEIVALRALHPDGLTARALAELLYGAAEREKTVRPDRAAAEPTAGRGAQPALSACPAHARRRRAGRSGHDAHVLETAAAPVRRAGHRRRGRPARGPGQATSVQRASSAGSFSVLGVLLE
jgi:hypothetical protein